jgi:deoxyribose-phosphate aldolase
LTKITREQLARMIDHTQLKPIATKDDIIKLCKEAKTHHFASVCVNPHYVSLASNLLKESDVKVCTVIGFPLGATTIETKAFEATEALRNGAHELDMVINLSALKSGDHNTVLRDVSRVVDIAKKHNAITKVIIETCYLTNEEKVKACTLAKDAKADFVKTSTGFGPSGATEEDVELMRRTVGPNLGVKAAGSISNLDKAIKMIEAGATRIGASRGVTIIEAFDEL